MLEGGKMNDGGTCILEGKGLCLDITFSTLDTDYNSGQSIFVNYVESAFPFNS